MKSVRIIIPGKPVPASRPRVTRWGTYDKEPYKSWKKTAPLFVASQMKGGMIEGAIFVHVRAHVPVKDKKRHGRRRQMRPDVDNFAKAALDACEGIVFPDDGAIPTLLCEKFDVAPGEERLVIDVRQIDPTDLGAVYMSNQMALCVRLCREMALRFTEPPCGGPHTKRWAERVRQAGLALLQSEEG